MYHEIDPNAIEDHPNLLEVYNPSVAVKLMEDRIRVLNKEIEQLKSVSRTFPLFQRAYEEKMSTCREKLHQCRQLLDEFEMNHAADTTSEV